ncbi:serpin A3-7-like [Planococcus citri]|uniref:serpin A3-7-like n=1 Tax=Planococcus citri TaxID=170843 RepID=UPI0031F7BEF0
MNLRRKMCKSKLIACLFEFILILICSVRFSSSQDDFDNDPKIVQNKILDFSAKLNRILHGENSQKTNILYSSINIYAALVLMHLGSVGKTRDEIMAVLGIIEGDEWPGIHQKFSDVFERISKSSQTASESQKYHINATDVIFLDRMTLRKDFVSRVRSFYDSDIINVNFLSNEFDAVRIINKYIANRVENQEPKFYTELQTAYPKVILASCLNFKSELKFPFRKSTTQRDTFHSTNRAIRVNMMQRVGKMPYANIQNLGVEVGRLIASNSISLFVVLPYQQYGLDYFLNNLVANDIKSMVSSVNENYLVDFKLPQTTLKVYNDTFHETLSQLGLQKILTERPDFQDMINEKYLFNVKEIKYAANLEITEQRIEASSVTGVKISGTVVVEPTPSDSLAGLLDNEVNFIDDYDYGNEKFADLQFHVNRPFFTFLYHHEIRTVLFYAAVENPNGN